MWNKLWVLRDTLHCITNIKKRPKGYFFLSKFFKTSCCISITLFGLPWGPEFSGIRVALHLFISAIFTDWDHCLWYLQTCLKEECDFSDYRPNRKVISCYLLVCIMLANTCSVIRIDWHHNIIRLLTFPPTPRQHGYGGLYFDNKYCILLLTFNNGILAIIFF